MGSSPTRATPKQERKTMKKNPDGSYSYFPYDHQSRAFHTEFICWKDDSKKKWYLAVLNYDDSISHGRAKAITMLTPIFAASTLKAVKELVNTLSKSVS